MRSSQRSPPQPTRGATTSSSSKRGASPVTTGSKRASSPKPPPPAVDDDTGIAPWDEAEMRQASTMVFADDGTVAATAAPTKVERELGHVPEGANDDVLNAAKFEGLVSGDDERSADGSDREGAVAETAGEEKQAQRRAIRRLIRGTVIVFDGSMPRDVVLVNAVETGCQVGHRVDKADIIWIEATPRTADYVRQLEHQRINFFPGMKAAATKCEFARLMGRVARLYPGEFDFIPKTFALPMEQKLLDEYRNTTWDKKRAFVVKPSCGNGGEGIYLTSDLKSISHPECVVQEYIANPLTLGGLKFDLRLYVAVTSIYPLRFYLHREGLGRMAVEPYEEPTGSNFGKINMHLTNYSLNKFSNKFVENTDALDDAHTTKRRATTAFRQLAAEYPDFDFDSVWSDITELVGKVIGALALHLLASIGEIPGRTQFTSRCFHLLGFDVLLDRDFQPHLLEINHHPSLLTDAPIDMYVKSRVVKPLLRMIALDARLNRKASRRKESFIPPTAEEAAAWEAQFTDDEEGWVSCDAAAAADIASRYMNPLLPILQLFIDGCSGASAKKYDEMSSVRFARLMRKIGLCGQGCPFSMPEMDLLFMKALQLSGEGNALQFYDFVDTLLGPIGDRVAPSTAIGSLERLRSVMQFIASASAA